MPQDRRARVRGYAALALVSVVILAVGAVLLVPLVGALFSAAPRWSGSASRPWPDGSSTRRPLGSASIGFAVLDHSQDDVVERLSAIRLDWFTADNTAMSRQAIAATGPELVGLVVNLLTPLSAAVLLPSGHRPGRAAHRDDAAARHADPGPAVVQRRQPARADRAVRRHHGADRERQLTVAEAVALIVVIARYLEPFTTVSELAPALESTRATLDRIRGVFTAPAVVCGSAGLPGTTGAARIEFDDVALGYDGTGTPVLDGVSFVLQPGTTTAIVGPSGFGKSTILALIVGLHQPARGRVVIDGVDAGTLSSDARRVTSSAVFQHPYLFHGSIRDNVVAGNPGAGEDQFGRAVALAPGRRAVRQVARLADTVVGEAGSALSGGERQRVSIARALLKPRDPGDVTPEWLSAALRERTSVKVSGVDVVIIGTGQTGATYRVTMHYTMNPGELPETFVIKLLAQDDTVRDRVVIGYRSECAFYTSVADRVQVPAPTCYFCQITDDAMEYSLLLADQAPAVQGDQIAGCGAQEARLSVRALAGGCTGPVGATRSGWTCPVWRFLAWTKRRPRARRCGEDERRHRPGQAG